MKSVWGGTLSFGLVSINIKLYSAVKEHSLGFKLLCGTCHRALSYERWCRHCNKEVAWVDTVKGLELEKGRYFVLTKEKIHALRPEKLDTLDIVEFVPRDAIEPIYYESHYYMAPAKEGEKAFFLFKKALQDSKTTAIGHFVMREKEYVCAIVPYDRGLLVSTLNYAYEIQDSSRIQALKKQPKITKQELQLAQKLIKMLTKTTFTIDKFKDTFAQRLAALVKKSTKGKKGKVTSRKKTLTGAVHKDLLATLQESLKKNPVPSMPRHGAHQAKIGARR